jgi:prevent-host-death family protein
MDNKLISTGARQTFAFPCQCVAHDRSQVVEMRLPFEQRTARSEAATTRVCARATFTGGKFCYMTMVMTSLRGFPVFRTIKASEFKAKCLALIDQVADTGNRIVITKNGKPLAELIPHRVPKRSPLGIWKDKVIIKGDIISPIDVEWDALK